MGKQVNKTLVLSEACHEELQESRSWNSAGSRRWFSGTAQATRSGQPHKDPKEEHSRKRNNKFNGHSREPEVQWTKPPFPPLHSVSEDQIESRIW